MFNIRAIKRIMRIGIVFSLCSASMVLRADIVAGSDKIDNKQRVINAFAAWEKGEGSPFSLLKKDAVWTVMGPSATAKSYSLEDLNRQLLEPFNKRLSGALTPRVIDIFQDGSTVIVLFEASAPTIDGGRYRNSYAWFLSMDNGWVTRVRAVLDVSAFDNLLAIKVKK